MTTRNKNLDLNQLATRIVGEATGEIEAEHLSLKDSKRLAKQKAATARSKSLTSEQRSEIAKKAAAKRWGSKQDEDVVSDLSPPENEPPWAMIRRGRGPAGAPIGV